MRLIDSLSTKPGGEELAHRVNSEIRVRALAKLEHTRDLFPDYTNHTVSHCDGVIRILDWLLPDEIKIALNEWEIYFLLAACYTHDLGMVGGCPGMPNGPEWDDYLKEFIAAHDNSMLSEIEIQRAATAEFVRDFHHIRSEQYIRENAVELGIRATDTPAEANLVGRIALGHRKVDLGDIQSFGPVPFESKFIRRNLLAAYLRLADELDTTAHRTPLAEFVILEINDETSEVEWAKHLSLSGVSIDNGVIVIGGECREHRVYLRLKRLHNEIRAMLAEIKRMLPRPYVVGDLPPINDPLPYHDIELRVEHVGYLPIEVKFDLQDEEIIKLIMGERLYGDATACIRELLQNAVDTCREAQTQRPISWSPLITVEESSDGAYLIVSDNGMGMDANIVRNYFSRVGISYYQSKEFGGSFRPISEFGIGFLSCFMLADRIEIESKREACDPIHLEISSVTRPFVPSRGTRKSPGTEVRLHLKPIHIGSIDVIDRVKYFARHVQYPITVTSRSGEKDSATANSMLPPAEDIANLAAGSIKYTLERRMKVERIQSCANVVELGDISVGVVLIDRILHKDYWRREVSTSRIFQDGFYVGEFRDEFEKFTNNAWCEVNLTGSRRFALTADRTRASTEDASIWRDIHNAYSIAIEELYEQMPQTDHQARWWPFHRQYYSWRSSVTPKLAESAEKYCTYCVFSKDGFETMTLRELLADKRVSVYVREVDHDQLPRIQNTLPEGLKILVLPDLSGVDKRHWPGTLARADRMKAIKAMIRSSQIRVTKTSIDGRSRLFFDAGYELGTWRLAWAWLKYDFGEGHNLYDARHPLSKLLVRHCKRKLPTRSRLVVAELFRLAHTLSEGEVQRRYHELIKALKEDLIIDVTVGPQPVATIDVGVHRCPYSVFESDSVPK